MAHARRHRSVTLTTIMSESFPGADRAAADADARAPPPRTRATLHPFYVDDLDAPSLPPPRPLIDLAPGVPVGGRVLVTRLPTGANANAFAVPSPLQVLRAIDPAMPELVRSFDTVASQLLRSLHQSLYPPLPDNDPEAVGGTFDVAEATTRSRLQEQQVAQACVLPRIQQVAEMRPAFAMQRGVLFDGGALPNLPFRPNFNAAAPPMQTGISSRQLPDQPAASPPPPSLPPQVTSSLQYGPLRAYARQPIAPPNVVEQVQYAPIYQPAAPTYQPAVVPESATDPKLISSPPTMRASTGTFLLPLRVLDAGAAAAPGPHTSTWPNRCSPAIRQMSARQEPRGLNESVSESFRTSDDRSESATIELAPGQRVSLRLSSGGSISLGSSGGGGIRVLLPAQSARPQAQSGASLIPAQTTAAAPPTPVRTPTGPSYAPRPAYAPSASLMSAASPPATPTPAAPTAYWPSASMPTRVELLPSRLPPPFTATSHNSITEPALEREPNSAEAEAGFAPDSASPRSALSPTSSSNNSYSTPSFLFFIALCC